MASVLVIEDNPVNMKLAALLLRNAGHTVLCAVDAEIGLALARATPPDLVLMDFQLPGMDGLTATTLLKRDPATAAIPVIALTAMAMKADREKCRLAGCDAYIAKPLHYRELYAEIDRLLPGNDGQAAAAPVPFDQPDTDAEAAATGIQAVNIAVLEGLIGDDPAAIRDFLNAFRITAAAIALDLKAACVDRRTLQAGKEAHKLKSSAHAVGALALSGLCAKMETAGKADSAEALMALLPLFERELDAVNAFLDSRTGQMQ